MRRVTRARRDALFREATSIVERDYREELGLDDVARRVATSRRQLQRVFAEVGGTTFRAYLTGVRMRRAAELLRDSSIPVQEVAARVGYRRPAQFSKAFRRHHGSPPSRHRVH
jgi:AraC family transcriptional regulator of adaptative response / methylphosphotriester-DNA alkyltransferase methyltransferase